MAAQVVDREVLVLALRQLPAAQGDRGAVGLVGAGCARQDRAGQSAAQGRGEAQEGRHVLHVRPHERGPLGVGRGGVRGREPLQHGVGEDAAGHPHGARTCDAHETNHTAITYTGRLVSPTCSPMPPPALGAPPRPLPGHGPDHRHGVRRGRVRPRGHARRASAARRPDRFRRALHESPALAVVAAVTAARPARRGRVDGAALPPAATALRRLATPTRRRHGRVGVRGGVRPVQRGVRAAPPAEPRRGCALRLPAGHRRGAGGHGARRRDLLRPGPCAGPGRAAPTAAGPLAEGGRRPAQQARLPVDDGGPGSSQDCRSGA